VAERTVVVEVEQIVAAVVEQIAVVVVVKIEVVEVVQTEAEVEVVPYPCLFQFEEKWQEFEYLIEGIVQ